MARYKWQNDVTKVEERAVESFAKRLDRLRINERFYVFDTTTGRPIAVTDTAEAHEVKVINGDES